MATSVLDNKTLFSAASLLMNVVLVALKALISIWSGAISPKETAQHGEPACQRGGVSRGGKRTCGR